MCRGCKWIIYCSIRTYSQTNLIYLFYENKLTASLWDAVPWRPKQGTPILEVFQKLFLKTCYASA